MSGAKILSTETYESMRDAQGINGGTTSPTVPTAEGAEYFDSILRETFKAKDALELLKAIEGYTDSEGVEHPPLIERGLISKDYIASIQKPNSTMNLSKDPNDIFGNISGSNGGKSKEWDHLFIPLDGHRPEDRPLTRRIIIDTIANPNFVYVKDPGGGRSKQYIPVIGQNSTFAWGRHDKQNTVEHFHMFRHWHTITDKNYEYNPKTGEVFVNTVNPNARKITLGLSLKDNFVRSQVLKNINDNLKAAGLPVLDDIYLSTSKMLSKEEREAEKVINTNDKDYLDNLYKNAREKAREDAKKEIEGLPKELVEDSIVQAELNELNALIKEKQKLAMEYTAKAIKENNEIQGFEKAREAVVALHQEKRINQELTTELDNVKSELESTKQSLTDETKLRETIEGQLTKTSSELNDRNEAYTALDQLHKDLEKDFDDLEVKFEQTVKAHKNEIIKLNQDRVDEIKALKTTHSEEIAKIEYEHSQEITNLNIAHKENVDGINRRHSSIVNGLNSEIKELNSSVSALTSERDELKFDKGELEKQLAELKRDMLNMERAHEEQLEKERKERAQEKSNFEEIINDYKSGKIELDKAITELRADNAKLSKEVQSHINKFNELKKENGLLQSDLDKSKSENSELKTKNNQLETDVEALKKAIEDDLEKKAQQKNKNKNPKPE
jgi:hypothetical protein